MSLFYRFCRSCLKGYFSLFYRLTIYGYQAPLQGKAIIASNHASFFDPPLLAVACPEEVHFLARASLFRNRFANWLISNLNAHPIRGTAQDIDSFRLVSQLLSEGKKVVIFPEGERSTTGQLQAMKSGIAMLALRMQCPIIPVYIHGSFEVWPRHQRWPKIRGDISCIFGEPIFPPESDQLNKKQMQEALTQQVQESLEKLKIQSERQTSG